MIGVVQSGLLMLMLMRLMLITYAYATYAHAAYARATYAHAHALSNAAGSQRVQPLRVWANKYHQINHHDYSVNSGFLLFILMLAFAAWQWLYSVVRPAITDVSQ